MEQNIWGSDLTDIIDSHRREEFQSYEMYDDEDEMVSELKSYLEENDIQYIMNSTSFDGGPGYSANYYVLSFLINGQINTIDFTCEYC